MPTSLPSRSRACRRSANPDQYGGLLACVALGLAILLLTRLTVNHETGSIGYGGYWMTALPTGEAGLEQLMFVFLNCVGMSQCVSSESC
jgi:hypothetical protein